MSRAELTLNQSSKNYVKHNIIYTIMVIIKKDDFLEKIYKPKSTADTVTIAQ
jgi:hypothetical protein